MDYIPFSNFENNHSLADMRRDYSRGTLENSSLQNDPLQQFHIWFQETLISEGVIEANAMVLSTTSHDLQITSRTVLLKGFRLQALQVDINSTRVSLLMFRT